MRKNKLFIFSSVKIISRLFHQPLWAGSILPLASCAPAALEVQPTSLQTPPLLPLWLSAKAPCATLLPPPIHLSLPTSSTTHPPLPTAHSGLVQLTACQPHSKPQYSRGLYLSAPLSHWGPTLQQAVDRARFLDRAHSRLSIRPMFCKSQSAAQADPN